MAKDPMFWETESFKALPPMLKVPFGVFRTPEGQLVFVDDTPVPEAMLRKPEPAEPAEPELPSNVVRVQFGRKPPMRPPPDGPRAA